jgi:hypothetical protein
MRKLYIADADQINKLLPFAFQYFVAGFCFAFRNPGNKFLSRLAKSANLHTFS